MQMKNYCIPEDYKNLVERTNCFSSASESFINPASIDGAIMGTDSLKAKRYKGLLKRSEIIVRIFKASTYMSAEGTITDTITNTNTIIKKLLYYQIDFSIHEYKLLTLYHGINDGMSLFLKCNFIV
jgi:hypothetical protein